MSTLSTHILDTAHGKPANRVAVYLESQNSDESWEQLAHAWTDEDGRVKPFFLLEEPLPAGVYRLVFDTDAYFSALGVTCFYPQVCVVFAIGEEHEHYHIPLLISPFGYSTYRGT